MTLEAEKEKVKAKFILKVDSNYSPISRFEHIPREDQQDLLYLTALKNRQGK